MEALSYASKTEPLTSGILSLPCNVTTDVPACDDAEAFLLRMKYGCTVKNYCAVELVWRSGAAVRR